MTIHIKNWMWTCENQPKTVNFDYMHEKFDVDGLSLKMPVEPWKST